MPFIVTMVKKNISIKNETSLILEILDESIKKNLDEDQRKILLSPGNEFTGNGLLSKLGTFLEKLAE